MNGTSTSTVPEMWTCAVLLMLPLMESDKNEMRVAVEHDERARDEEADEEVAAEHRRRRGARTRTGARNLLHLSFDVAIRCESQLIWIG